MQRWARATSKVAPLPLLAPKSSVDTQARSQDLEKGGAILKE